MLSINLWKKFLRNLFFLRKDKYPLEKNTSQTILF